MALFYLNLFHSSLMLRLLLDKVKSHRDKHFMSKETSSTASVAVQGVTYLAKLKQIPMQCFSPADRV